MEPRLKIIVTENFSSPLSATNVLWMTYGAHLAIVRPGPAYDAMILCRDPFQLDFQRSSKSRPCLYAMNRVVSQASAFLRRSKIRAKYDNGTHTNRSISLILEIRIDILTKRTLLLFGTRFTEKARILLPLSLAGVYSDTRVRKAKIRTDIS